MYIKPFCISSTKYSLHINEWPSKHISINVNFPLQTLFTYFSLIILSKPSQIFFLCAQSCKNLFSLIHVPLKLKVLSIFMICWHAYLHIHHANYKLTVPCRHRHTHTRANTHTSFHIYTSIYTLACPVFSACSTAAFKFSSNSSHLQQMSMTRIQLNGVDYLEWTLKTISCYYCMKSASMKCEFKLQLVTFMLNYSNASHLIGMSRE